MFLQMKDHVWNIGSFHIPVIKVCCESRFWGEVTWIGNRKFPIVSGARTKFFQLIGIQPLSFWLTCG